MLLGKWRQYTILTQGSHKLQLVTNAISAKYNKAKDYKRKQAVYHILPPR